MRVMTVLDVDAVLAIEQEVQPYPWSRGNFCDALESGYLCYVYVSGEVLLGFAVLMAGVNEAELLNIAVLSGQQRKGWGRAMLEAVLEVAAIRQLSRVFLEVRASNAPAIALYRRAGFSQIGLRRAYYRNEKGSEDALVMACDLSGKQNG
jgi:ribosomal-protein-alanine N-acetyltransferase